MGSGIKEVTVEYFKSILKNDFTEAVNNNECGYDRLEYNTWRRLMSMNGKTVIMVAKKSEETLCITYPDKNSIMTSIVFNIYDCSLGEYLYKYFNYDYNDAKKISSNIEEKNMTDNKMFGFDFGPVKNDAIRISMYGIAVKNKNGSYVSYNNGDIIDVDIMNFSGKNYLFKMPVALKEVAIGDIILHNGIPMFVTGKPEGRDVLEVVDVNAGESKTVIPTKNMFNFNFVTKIVSMFAAMDSKPTAEAPFGNMLPFMMMENGSDMDPMMLMMMMNGGKLDMSNPMLMYAMMKDSEGSDMLPMLMMMNMNK